MNKLFTKIATAFVGIAMAVGVGVAVGNNTNFVKAEATATSVSKNSFSAKDGTFDDYIRFDSYQGGGTSNAAVYSNAIRLYQNSSSSTAGGMFVVSVYTAGATITKVGITSSSDTTMGYKTGDTHETTTASTYTSVGLTANTMGYTADDLGATAVTITCLGTTSGTRLNIKAVTVWYNDGVNFGTLDSIAVNNAKSTHKTVFELNESFSSSGLVLTATDTESNTKSVNSGFTCSGYNTATAGNQTVTVSYTESTITRTTTYSITVLAEPIYNSTSSSWTGWAASGTYDVDRIISDTSTYSWRMSESELYSPSSKYLLGNYNKDYCEWDNFSGKGYYSSIASAITANTYGFAMYSQNFVVNRPTRIQFSWTVVNAGSTNSVYILYSTNGGYSWTQLADDSATNSNKTISWVGTSLNSTDNVLVALAFTSSSQSSSLDTITVKINGTSLTKKNAWAVREITVSGNDNVEAEQTTQYSATVVTEGYETPANTNISWSSGTTSVATVNSTGLVSGVAVGSASIIATAADGNGAYGSKNIAVTEKLKRLGTITLNTDNVQKSFVRNSAFNYTGLVVTANYANGFASETVTPTSVSTPNMSVAGNGKTVTVTYTINGTSANASYTINVTPIVSETITIEGTGVSLVEGRYKITTGPSDLFEITVSCDGDEESITATPSNNKIYYEDGYLNVESTENDSGTITFTAGNATAYLDVTVIADETLSYVSPVNGQVSCIQNQTVSFEFSLVNATQGVWKEPTNSAYTIVGTGDNTGYFGEITLNEVCSNLEAEFSVTTSKDTLTISLFLTATADSITAISVKTNPTKTTYVVGETFSSSGLVVSASRLSGVGRDLASNEINLKNAPTVLNVRGVVTIDIELVSDTTKTTSFNITVNKPSGLKLVTKTSNDDGRFEGTLITNASGLTAGMKVAIGSSAKTDLMGTYYPVVDNINKVNINSVTSDVSYNSSAKKFTFTDKSCVYILGGSEGAWTLRDFEGNYIYAAGGTENNNWLKSCDGTGDETITWSISISSDNATIKTTDSTVKRHTIFHNSSNALYSCYASGQSAVQLYSVVEYEETFSYSAVDLTDTIYDFVRKAYNNSDLYTCNDSGTGSDLSHWNDADDLAEFTALSSTDKTNLANAVLKNQDESLVTCELVANYLRQYDYVVWKYGESYDYLGRVTAGTAVVKQGMALNSFEFNVSSNAATFIAIVAVVSTLSVGGFFFIRKKKNVK